MPQKIESYICEKYPAGVDQIFCSRRYKKAIDTQDSVFKLCKDCDKGKKAWDKLHIEAKAMHSVPCEHCGSLTNDVINKTCAACRYKRIKKMKRPETKVIVSEENNTKGEESMGTKKLCSKEGCEKGPWRQGMCFKHFFEAYPDKQKPAAKKNQSLHPSQKGKKTGTKVCKKCGTNATSNVQPTCKECGEPFWKKPSNTPSIKNDFEHRQDPAKVVEHEVKKQAEVNKDNGKAECIGKLLYASELLDGQIESSLDNGIVDTNILIKIRKNIGDILRASLPPAEVAA